MNYAKNHAGWVIVFTVVAALILQLVPIPELLKFWRPDLVALTLLYWCLALPHRVGVTIGWLCGLTQDLLLNSLLGQHALGLSLACFVAVRMHRQIRLFPLWQQTLVITGILAFMQFLSAWVNGIQGHVVTLPIYLGPVLAGGAMWPVTFVVLRKLRRAFLVT